MALNSNQRAACIDNGLIRAAEQIGDVTEPAMERFYRQYPDALAAFEAHALGNRTQLEGGMVENALYCLMNWLNSRAEVSILLRESVMHHADTLHIPPAWYAGLLDAVADVVVSTIPAENAVELRAWQDLQGELRDFIADIGRHCRPLSRP